ncbi:MAG: radical SAM protein [bacterium]
MKTLIINAPFIKDFCRCQRWPAKTRGRVLRMPDWLAYATAVLEEAGEEVELYDFPAMNWDKAKLSQLIKDKQPQFVVLDSTTPSIYSDIECARLAKQESHAKVIMVGTHATALPEQTLKEAKGSIDVIALGEYDYTIRDIVQNWNKLESIPGICYLDNGVFKSTPPRPLITDLDNLPFPAWHHLDIMKYFDGGKLYPYINIFTSRGCPYQCTFCLLPQMMFGHKHRVRSAKNIVDEIESDINLFPQIRKGEFFFEDDTFTINKQRVLALCEEIMRRKLKITWSCNARPDIYDLKMFKDMKASGCRLLLVGFESGDQEMLNRMRKGMKVEDSIEFMKVAKEAGLEVHGCFVFGMPGETKETMEKTLNFALKLGLTTVQFAGAVPFPGTEYYNFCQSQGLLKAKSWTDWLAKGEQAGIVDYPGLSSKEINDYVDKALKSFYLRPGYMWKFLLKTKDVRDLYRKLRGAWSFINYLLTSRNKNL